MSLFTSPTPSNTRVAGIGEVTRGVTLLLFDPQPVGSASLQGRFQIQSVSSEDTMAMHLGEELSHNEFVRLRSVWTPSEAVHEVAETRAGLMRSLAYDPGPMHLVNTNLFHPSQWSVIGCGCGCENDVCAWETLKTSIQGKDSAETLAVLKVAWKVWLKAWFDDNPTKRDVVQQFVYGKCATTGIKTYDELTGVEMLLRHGFDRQSYNDACEQYGIVVHAESKPKKPDTVQLPVWQMLGGGEWDGAQIKFNSAKQADFHNLNLALIKDEWTKPDDCKLEEKSVRRLCVITDPRTDPTEDDAATLMALVNGNKQLSIWSHIDVLVTGCANSLDARHEGIATLVSGFPNSLDDLQEFGTVSILVAPVVRKDGKEKHRFLAPYGGDVGEHPLEDAALADRKHVVDRIPIDTTQLIVIGQVPGDFFAELTKAKTKLAHLQDVSVQGPGFNLMGVFGQDNIGAQITEFRAARPGVEFYWSDNTSGLRITKDQADDRIDALGQHLNKGIPSARAACITSFWATAGKHGQFESQFGDGNGYSYARDTAALLTKIGSPAPRDLPFSESGL